jgi:hypothetical protein
MNFLKWAFVIDRSLKSRMDDRARIRKAILGWDSGREQQQEICN